MLNVTQLLLLVETFYLSFVGSLEPIKQQQEPTWDYAGKILGPKDWGKKFVSCNRNSQSPINFNKVYPSKNASSLILNGSCENVKVLSSPNEYSWKILNGTCTASTLESGAFDLSQFHIHTPSEHTINYGKLDAEIHFVHSKSNGSRLLVVGLLLDCSAEYNNDWLDMILDSGIENCGGAAEVKNLKIPSYHNSIVATTNQFYNYRGSLTAPPCSEIVDWWVMKEPVKCSKLQFVKLKLILKKLSGLDNGCNARPIQLLNNRIVSIVN